MKLFKPSPSPPWMQSGQYQEPLLSADSSECCAEAKDLEQGSLTAGGGGEKPSACAATGGGNVNGVEELDLTWEKDGRLKGVIGIPCIPYADNTFPTRGILLLRDNSFKKSMVLPTAAGDDKTLWAVDGNSETQVTTFPRCHVVEDLTTTFPGFLDWQQRQGLDGLPSGDVTFAGCFTSEVDESEETKGEIAKEDAARNTFVPRALQDLFEFEMKVVKAFGMQSVDSAHFERMEAHADSVLELCVTGDKTFFEEECGRYGRFCSPFALKPLKADDFVGKRIKCHCGDKNEDNARLEASKGREARFNENPWRDMRTKKEQAIAKWTKILAERADSGGDKKDPTQEDVKEWERQLKEEMPFFGREIVCVFVSSRLCFRMTNPDAKLASDIYRQIPIGVVDDFKGVRTSLDLTLKLAYAYQKDKHDFMSGKDYVHEKSIKPWADVATKCLRSCAFIEFGGAFICAILGLIGSKGVMFYSVVRLFALLLLNRLELVMASVILRPVWIITNTEDVFHDFRNNVAKVFGQSLQIRIFGKEFAVSQFMFSVITNFPIAVAPWQSALVCGQAIRLYHFEESGVHMQAHWHGGWHSVLLVGPLVAAIGFPAILGFFTASRCVSCAMTVHKETIAADKVRADLQGPYQRSAADACNLVIFSEIVHRHLAQAYSGTSSVLGLLDAKYPSVPKLTPIQQPMGAPKIHQYIIRRYGLEGVVRGTAMYDRSQRYRSKIVFKAFEVNLKVSWLMMLLASDDDRLQYERYSAAAAIAFALYAIMFSSIDQFKLVLSVRRLLLAIGSKLEQQSPIQHGYEPVLPSFPRTLPGGRVDQGIPRWCHERKQQRLLDSMDQREKGPLQLRGVWGHMIEGSDRQLVEALAAGAAWAWKRELAVLALTLLLSTTAVVRAIGAAECKDHIFGFSTWCVGA